MGDPAPSAGIEARYCFVERVGGGSAGEVHRGFERATRRPVAIKRLRSASADPQAAARLAREARLLARVEHPNVVRVLDFGDDSTGRPCLVLEWLDGEDLARRQLVRPLDVPEALEVARQAALGLAALHAVGVVHRDVKPANFVLLAGEDPPRVKLLDLGISRAVDETALTTHGLVVGSPAYMSPEQARGDEPLSAAADQFSLGVLLYELLAGQRPFRGADPFAVLAKIVLEPAPRLRDARAELHPALDALVATALARDPTRRFASMAAFADALVALPDEARAPRSARPARATPGAAPARPPASTPPAARIADREQRVVTALFAAFSEGPEGGRALDGFSHLVGEHGGVPVRTLGRRAIGLFGAHRSSGDEPVRAARAALAAAAVLPQVRLAVVTGRALTGAEDVSGEALDRGALLLERAHGAVRIDAPTARLLEPYFRVERVYVEGEGEGEGEAPHRGLFTLRAARTGDDEAAALLLGRRTPTVGRDRELSLLNELYAECVGEPVARAVLVTGPAGAGKSRLRQEFLRQVRARGSAEVLFGRGDSLGVATPFGPLADALRRAAGVLEHEPLALRRERLVARVERVVPPRDARRVAEFLGEVTGVPAGEGASDALRAARGDAVLMGDAIREAWEDFLLAECARGPVLLVLEDVQWADGPTVRLVGSALRRLEGAPLLVMALARPEVHRIFPSLWSAQSVHELRLGPLTRRASERLVREALGAAVSDDVVRMIVERADGHAFYLEELVRAVAGVAPRALPDTVLGMVQARLDALPQDPRRVLRAASVYGQRFWRGGVAALFGDRVGSTPLGGCLDELVLREVIVRKSAPTFEGETEYHFSHALLREAAYASLTDEDREAAHRVAGAWLARAGEADAAALAAHYDRGRAPRSAAGWYCVAAEQALDVNDFAGAVERAERGAACLRIAAEQPLSGDELAGREADDELRGMLRLLQADAHAWRGEQLEAAARADEALECLPRGSAAWFRAVGRLVGACAATGSLEAAEPWVRAARGAPAHTPEARAARLACLSGACEAWAYAGRVDEGEALLAELAPVARGTAGGRFAESAAARHRVASAALARARGRLDACALALEDAVDQFDQADDGRQLWRARCELGWCYARLGDVDRGESLLRSALATAERSGLAAIAAWARRYLAALCARTERYDEALALAARVLDDAAAMRSPALEAGAHAARAWVSLVRAAGPEALALAAGHAEASLRCGALAPATRAGSLALLARARAAQGQAAEAEALALAALVQDALAGGATSAGESALELLGLLAERSGDAKAAREHARAASDRLLRRAGSIEDPRRRAGWLDAVEAARRALPPRG